VRLIFKRIALVLALWLLLTATTVIKCGSGSFDDDDDKFKPGRNRQPVASSSFLQTSFGQSVSGRMEATDPDGDSLTYRVTSGPDTGSLNQLDDRTGFFVYVPAELGSDEFTFRANDGELDSNTATVVIRVTLAATGVAGKPVSGVRTVMPDPTTADGLIVVWGGPEAVLERIPGGSGVSEPLLAGVAAIAADAWQAGRLAVLLWDGRLLLSSDGGRRWALAASLLPPVGPVELALAGERLLVAHAVAGCDPDNAGLWRRAAALNIAEICGTGPLLDADGRAFYLSGAPAARRLHAVGAGRPLPVAAVRAAWLDTGGAGHLWAVIETGAAAVLARSDDAGVSWAQASALPPGTVISLWPEPGGDRLWLALATAEGGTRIYRRAGDAEWLAVAELATPGGQLTACDAGACFLDLSGRRMWALADAPTAARGGSGPQARP